MRERLLFVSGFFSGSIGFFLFKIFGLLLVLEIILKMGIEAYMTMVSIIVIPGAFVSMYFLYKLKNRPVQKIQEGGPFLKGFAWGLGALFVVLVYFVLVNFKLFLSMF